MTRQTLRILLIDDNQADAELLRRALGRIEEFDVDFSHCLDADSGRRSLAADGLDCLFLDYRLGERDGLDTLAAIRAAGNDIPVIVLTGLGSETVAVQAMKRGAQDYILKDDIARMVVTPKALHRTITNALEQVKLQRLVTEKQQELEAFVSVASHDLKAPLCSVKDNLELLRDFYRDRPLDSDGREFLHAAIRMLDRMSKLIESLLEYSRSGRSSKVFEAVDLKSCIESVVENLSSLIEKTDARVVVGAMPPAVTGDDEALFQLLQNLVTNGIKFRSSEPPVIQIGAIHEGSRWTISIEDNGIGIDPKYHADIFAPFKRLHSRREIDGSGVGLATCRRIAAHHGGRLRLRSRPGEGSVFYFTLEEAAPQESPWPADSSGADPLSEAPPRMAIS